MLDETIGVRWDINTCPVPDGIEPERIDHEVLKEPSSSGILIRHVPFGSLALCDHLREWKNRYPFMRRIMLISGYPSFKERTGGDPSQNVSCLSVRTLEKKRSNIPRGFNKTVGVWWDINTCPVPDGYDPGRVRSRIESALHEYLGPGCPITIFCVGNLEYISPQVLKNISSSGILLRHTFFRGMAVSDLLREWEKRNLPPAKIMLISADGLGKLIGREIMSYGYKQLYVIPLTENSSLSKDSNNRKDDELDSWFCTLCKIHSQSCDDFINHLKSTSHLEKLWKFVPVDDNHIAPIYCKFCKYPGYDTHNMKIHLFNEEHAQKVKQGTKEDRLTKANKKRN
ncbi:hypothetical protein AALP_AA8G042600 [Arabis alpina]|uniref:NYN domain-containing protein n=1 Tax=Arabis alpina TaxID=50452 RepID=A0A087G4X2_ARAAL|nr:hypothetical protein AALP_AA8G042600 [Arabis alpina]